MVFSRFPDPIVFDWDDGNLTKNLEKHKVTCQEAEEAFFYFSIIDEDQTHSVSEARYRMLGRTNEGRYLVIIFTIRKERVRVISARDANKIERLAFNAYEKATKTDSTI